LRGLGYTRQASLHETPRTLKNLVDTWLRQALARLPESMHARLALAAAARVVIRNALRLLGVASPDTV
jgi:hypothetical protein